MPNNLYILEESTRIPFIIFPIKNPLPEVVFVL